MSALLKFCRLSRREQWFLLKSFALTVAVRAALDLLPHRVLLALVSRARAGRVRSAESVDRIAWAVRAASRAVPRATCLTQAIAVSILMVRRGYDAQVSIGVAAKQGGIDAHAWVEHNGEIVIGGPRVQPYTSLAAI